RRCSKGSRRVREFPPPAGGEGPAEGGRLLRSRRLLRQPRLVPCRRVAVDDALGEGAVDLRVGRRKGLALLLGVERPESLDGGPQARDAAPVAGSLLRGLSVAFLGGLDVGHGCGFSLLVRIVIRDPGTGSGPRTISHSIRPPQTAVRPAYLASTP